MEHVIYTHSEEETEQVAAELGKSLFPGAVVLLQGDLGAGKTVFARGVGQGLGVATHIQSPTFTLMNAHQGRIPFYHFDLYRLESEEELFELGMEEYLDGDGVSLLEWAEKFPEYFTLPVLQVTIEVLSATKRRLVLRAEAGPYEQVITALAAGGTKR
ncbi:tRNA (adenosine(37)-N6)-threonylcarbamoyltransferase complex ATPase subunit type 1 TsaE [Dethiobacter alkaliphilus]|uniref:tRNA threonylcarbamoyladenosine biosynthesis protein TsaE n=1 Tax=Dethiobacter alkaliphilus AHT 1 TaxID=555088 RepID=C0GCU6_DETAL|nr:tRNA (adenosine(37)-N6)-threonylcarbamoyltransferase complex ATPase subunit type 1 TsaE [Dethiobacter alkaliphilus]EEG79031.1 protein of unknown function UPF0079 [Dethiobacter alkaliphilus AHT 1]